MTDRIVMIGASTDGIQAISRILADLPADLAAPVFVVQHVGRLSRGYLPSILARSAALRVLHPFDGQAIEHGYVYVAPPDRHLLIAPGRVRVVADSPVHYLRPAIDPLFRSGAIAYGPGAIGVVLTGHLRDGTAGLRAIKEHGGLAIVQDPAEAGAPSMPSSALAHVAVDYRRRVADIGPLLVQLVGRQADDGAVAGRG